jgi:hypothetical protein
VIASGIQPLQNLIVLIYVGEEKKKEWAQHWINRGFRGRLTAPISYVLISYHCIQTSSGVHPASYPVVTRDSFHGGESAGS